MDDRRVGRLLRAIRHRLGRRQEDVGADAGVSQDVVSRAERGQLAPLTIGRLRAIATTLDADLIISLRWHGVELDRLLDEGHATLGGRVVQLLDAAGWDVRPEVSYSVFGERGSIDLLAWHLQTRTLLVIEIKTELASLETTIRKLDEKVRLAPRIGDERFDWQPRAVSYLLVITATSTPRRQVQRHAAVMDKVFPVRGGALRKWLAAPSGTIGGLMFRVTYASGAWKSGPCQPQADPAHRRRKGLSVRNGACGPAARSTTRPERDWRRQCSSPCLARG